MGDPSPAERAASDKLARERAAREHWAFRSIRHPAPPPVRDSSWVRNPIDCFILARLEKEGLAPSPEADRAASIRRLSLDLLGLPPSPEEVDAFLADARPSAWEALADRLLASPHHGERWARHWLDAARYADSNGYTIDGSRSIWKYRDWVIEALQRDLPFDRFAIAQIAGDLLPDATLEDRIATGFHRNTPRNEEGGTDPEQFRVEAVADRVSTTANVFMGLTAGCARCHDHKYDPFSQREYFQLFAFFNNCDEPALPVPTAQQARELPALATEIAAAEKLLADNEVGVEKRRQIWEKDLPKLEVDWTPLETVPAAGAVESPLRILTVVPRAGITALRLEILRDEKPAAAARIAGVKAFAAPPGESGDPFSPLPLVPAVGSAEVFLLKEPSLEAGSRIALVLEAADRSPRPSRLRVEATTAPAAAAGLPEDVRAVLARPAAERSKADDGRASAYFRTIDKDFIPLAARVADLTKRRDDLNRSVTTTLVVEERKAARETRVHVRGDFLRPGDIVECAVPAVLPPLAARGPRGDRLDFARWLVSRENPLTARVIVNRVWQAYFGRGLVATENDFGTRGEPPTHPELLDWLAGELIDGGWSLQRLHRLIVTSATYRQSSRSRPELFERDPDNRLLGRQPRLRLEAEIIRDEALAASGLFSDEIGGPGVYPPQPQGLFRFTQTAKYWKESTGSDRYRRGMYTYFWRSSPYPFLMTFDAPDGTQACTRRVRSNTPLQALTLANDPAFVELASALARRAMREAGPADRDRAVRVFRLALVREPNARELDRLLALVDWTRGRRAGQADGGQSEGERAAEEAVWTRVARVVLNLDEFVNRE